MNSCRSTREQLPAYLDNELDADALLSLERHLADCAACRTEAEGLRLDDRLLRATVGARITVSDRMAEGVWARIAEEDAAAARPAPAASETPARPAPRPGRSGVRVRFPFGLRVGAFAGGFAVASMLLLMFLFRPEAPGPMDMQIAALEGGPMWRSAKSEVWSPMRAGMILHAGDTVKTDGDGRVELAWMDGSKAILGPNGESSALHLFPGVELKQGRLWAKVKRRQPKDAPFTVRSPQATAQVVGTEWVMEVQPARKLTTLVVRQGAVHFFNAKGSVTAREWTMSHAASDAAPTAPAQASPLAPNAMWWLKK